MSVRSIEYGSHKKCSHTPSRKTKNPSWFPRHWMKYYEGTHLGMRRHLLKSGPVSKRDNYSYVKSSVIVAIINKFIGKPYSDLCRKLNEKFKECKTNFEKDVDDELGWYFQFDVTPIWRRKYADYYIDDNGNVQKTQPLPSDTPKLTKDQKNWNRNQKIPNWGAVCEPRKWQTEPYSECESCNEGDPIEGSNKGEFYKPKLIGEFWCIVQNQVLKLPVYHVPKAYEYFRWIENARWRISNSSSKYSYLFREGMGKEEAEKLEQDWIRPHIEFTHGIRANTFFYQSCKVSVPNPRINILKKDIAYLKNNELSDGWSRGTSVEELEAKLANEPEVVLYEAGYGKLCPLVKRSDYENELDRIKAER